MRDRASLCVALALLSLAYSVPTHTNKTQTPSKHASHQMIHGDLDRVTGVWTVTKIISLTGPTVAIFMCKKVRDVFERYEPLVSTNLMEMVRTLQSETRSPLTVRGFLWLSALPEDRENAYVTKIANEVIRLTNARLRERAVISRIQMDEDQYEFSKRISGAEVRDIAYRVMEDVLGIGSGVYLTPVEKDKVRALVHRSVN